MTDTLTRSRIEEALARANAANEGPWESHAHDEDTATVEIPDGMDDMMQLVWHEGHGITAMDKGNAAFIAEARSDVPAMAGALIRVLDLHKPEAVEVIAQFAPEGYEEWPSVLVSVCSHCLPGYVRDQMDDDEADESDVRAFLYPCATVRAITDPESGGSGS